jgi:hypothetical protein
MTLCPIEWLTNTPALRAFFTDQNSLWLCLGMLFKPPLLLVYFKNIVVSEEHKVTVLPCVKVIDVELDLLRCDLPVLYGFHSQEGV